MTKIKIKELKPKIREIEKKEKQEESELEQELESAEEEARFEASGRAVAPVITPSREADEEPEAPRPVQLAEPHEGEKKERTIYETSTEMLARKYGTGTAPSTAPAPVLRQVNPLIEQRAALPQVNQMPAGWKEEESAERKYAELKPSEKEKKKARYPWEA